MKISIVITTYNRSDLLKNAIISVSEQTYHDIEIIVVDDASSCDNQHVINSFNLPIIYYRFEINQGGNVCRNKGVSLSKGGYIAFLDDDDTWRKDKIKKQYEFMIINNLDLSYTGKNIITINKNPSERYSFSEPNFINLKKSIMLKNFIGTTSSIMLKKDNFLDIGGFDIRMPALQDYELYIRFIYENFSVGGIDEAMVNYFIYPTNANISKSIKKKLIASKIMVCKNYSKGYILLLVLNLAKNIFKSIILGHR